MTRLHREFITCNYCGNEEPMTLFDLIDLEEDPDLKERILQKDIQLFHCSNCGRTQFVANPLIYLDPIDHLVISVIPHPGEGIEDEGVEHVDDESFDPEMIETLIQKMTEQLPDLTEEALEEGYRLRLVSSYNALIEKIHIFDDGLDDNVIELLKLALLTRSYSEDQAKVQALFYLHTDAEVLLFRSWDEEHGWDNLFVPSEAYLSATRLLEPHLEAEGTWRIVDRDLALDYLNILQREAESSED